MLAVAVRHGPGTEPHALRLRASDGSIGYTGDTGWVEELVAVAEGVDLLLCEAFTAEARPTTHLALADVVAHRPRLGCRRLLLTHLGADLLARLDEIPFEVAEDDMVVELGGG